LSNIVTHFLPDGAPRLDRFLADSYPDIARSRWDLWVRAGHVRVNGVAITKGGTRVRAGATVETELPERVPAGLHLEPEDIDLPTLFEDSHLWIIDKPAGMVVHPGPGHASGTVLNALLGRLRVPVLEADALLDDEVEEGEDELPAKVWPGLVHRLDRYTTGCLAMAKDVGTQQSLQLQFKERTVEKRYLAVVRMSRKLPEVGSVLVDEPIARHRVDRLKMAVNAAGRPSQTRVKLLASACGLALVECELLTGRTHQIRLHLSFLGAPILGDALYGGAPSWLDSAKHSFLCPHPMLHAWKLSINHPGDGRRLDFQAPVPEAYQEILARLGLAVP
jgi:23S rRNA pseudouridine1911/1915/1917 synthase